MTHPALLDDLPAVELRVQRLAHPDESKQIAPDAIEFETLVARNLKAARGSADVTTKKIVIALKRLLSSEIQRLENLGTIDPTKVVSAKQIGGRARKAFQLRIKVDAIDHCDKPAELLRVLSDGILDLKGPIRSNVVSLLIADSINQLGVQVGANVGGTSRSAAERIDILFEFATNVLIEEGIKQLAIGEDQKKRLTACVPVGLLNQERARFSTNTLNETESIWAIPCRGLAGELSGYICDSCWTGETLALDRYPTLVPVLFVRNRGKSNASFAGATMMIPTVTSDNELAVIVRGFNPLQNILSTLDAGSFLEEYLDAVSPELAKRGYSVILAPHDPVSASSTNRPAVGKHL